MDTNCKIVRTLINCSNVLQKYLLRNINKYQQSDVLAKIPCSAHLPHGNIKNLEYNMQGIQWD